MKIRLTENSIRIRLSTDELTSLADHKSVVTSIRISIYDQLICEISSWNLEVSEARFESGKLAIQIPDSFASKWLENPASHIQFQQENGSSKPLFVLIEKDLQKA